MAIDPMKPGASLLCKLVSITVHADELLSPLGHEVDREALAQVVRSPDVQDWVIAMGKLGLAPVKRTWEDLRLIFDKRKK